MLLRKKKKYVFLIWQIKRKPDSMSDASERLIIDSKLIACPPVLLKFSNITPLTLVSLDIIYFYNPKLTDVLSLRLIRNSHAWVEYAQSSNSRNNQRDLRNEAREIIDTALTGNPVASDGTKTPSKIHTLQFFINN